MCQTGHREWCWGNNGMSDLRDWLGRNGLEQYAGPLPQYYLGLAAEVLLAAGRPADGLAHLDRAIAGIDEPGIGFYLPEIYRLRGACLLALDRDDKDEARSAFATALDIARRQGAVIFQRRAEACLSELSSNGSRR
jgi:tetratricopeptide (TPR) repeat protein